MTVLGQWTGTTEGSVVVHATFFDESKRFCKRRAVLKPDQKTSSFTLELTRPCVLRGATIDRDSRTLTVEDHTYFVSITPAVEFGAGNDQFYWSFSLTNNGQAFQYQDQLSEISPCRFWTAGTECGLELASDATDLCMQISGTSRQSPDGFEHLRNFIENHNATRRWRHRPDGNQWEAPHEENQNYGQKRFSERLTAEQDSLAREMSTLPDRVTTVRGTSTWFLPILMALGAMASLLVFVLVLFALRA